ncbi:hypothetical protein [Verminephrobacter aporrectodeae]|uniref:hypothetical protein n=1 Tax=Verminephrobacter aporrectodeae TaxID=1110389 RepID=UPI00023768C3|nr:hypothetical protein [Verminephrobacter aporrectodeae]MCW8163905.1 hypothetical protein [Verminephrobacter aporrectodeae subsp. tuberculatae]MCW8168139.1 hypothetical protein [Verminephrobacter aporrectodeae subsp. tuberculatae]MCW8175042.1 hypothetical protein [Verminephrobacter aporrectodeae subsp. tuberculatae]MCW8202344.1 hypothetical protein [Verminephrobacter aporrectodeae subsp. tuberculatae]MCW8206025.1 hypothetical protein [Verminephrobacter aporrectodeae subsp. tuberculatae]
MHGHRLPHHDPLRPAARRAALARIALLWLLLALVAVPTLGHLHRVVHADAPHRVHADHADTHGLLERLLGNHDSPLDCLSFDQLALGDGPLHSGVPVALPTLAAAQAPVATAAERPAAQRVVPFQARAPPA